MRVARRWHFISGGAHIFLGSLVLGSPCSSLDTCRILGSWPRRAVFSISSTFTNSSHASVRSRCHGRVWRSRYMLDHTSGCTDGSSDVPQLPRHHSLHVWALGGQGVLEAKAREHFHCTARSHISHLTTHEGKCVTWSRVAGTTGND